MPIPTPEPPVDTYTPVLWATLSADEQYAEYVRVRALILQRAQEIAELKVEIRDYEEREAAVCPEDVGFDEYIGWLTKQLDARAQEIEQVKAELNQAIYNMDKAREERNRAETAAPIPASAALEAEVAFKDRSACPHCGAPTLRDGEKHAILQPPRERPPFYYEPE